MLKEIVLIVILLFVTSILTGCGSGGVMDITKLPVSDETITTVTGGITDTSVQKEAIFADMVKNRDNAYKQMYAKSGFNVKFKLVEVAPGVKIQMMEEVSFKETPRFEQPLPTGPSEHPVWKFATAFTNKGLDTFLWWTGIKEIFNTQNKALDSAQTKYYGDYNPQTAKPYIAAPEGITLLK